MHGGSARGVHSVGSEPSGFRGRSCFLALAEDKVGLLDVLAAFLHTQRHLRFPGLASLRPWLARLRSDRQSEIRLRKTQLNSFPPLPGGPASRWRSVLCIV